MSYISLPEVPADSCFSQITLFDDEASAEAVQHQLRAAENAGVDVSSMEWLNSSELIEVRGRTA